MRTPLLAASIVIHCLSVTELLAQAPSGEEVLAGMEKKYKHELLPKALRPPMTKEQADAFAAAVKFFRDGAKEDLKKIEAVAAPKDDRSLRQTRERLLNWVGREVPRQLDEALSQTRHALKGQVNSGTEFVKFAADIEMTDTDKVRNNFANPANVELRQQSVRDTLAAIDLLIRLDEQLGEKSGWPEKKKAFEAIASQFREKLAAAATLVMPPADTGDAELRKVAEATLKDPKYGVKEWKRLIVNSAKQVKSYSVYEVRDRTIVRVDYDYDQFQATTIEQEGNDLFLFHNDLAFYRSGAPTTPTGKWVVRERFRGARIVPENVNK